MKLSLKSCIVLTLLYIFASFQPVFSAEIDTKVKPDILVNQILDNLENHFSGSGFSADFYQESPLPDIGITESAAGKAYFKKPEKFRWEYQTPDILHYISDGSNLWIHNPEDNNVWIGKTADFFGKQSSASVLTDIKLIRKMFTVKMAEKTSETDWELFLFPSSTGTFGISKMLLSINKKTGNISKIISFNISNTETRITLNNYDFKKIPSDTSFDFKPPKNANIIPLE